MGAPQWNYAINVDRSTASLADDGTIYFGSSNNNLYAINPDGTLKWSYTAGGPIYCPPSIAGDGTVYVGANDDKIIRD